MPFFDDEYTMLQAGLRDLEGTLRRAGELAKMDKAFSKSVIDAANVKVHMDIADEMLKPIGVSNRAEQQANAVREAALMQSPRPQAYAEQVKVIGRDMFGSFLTELPRVIANQQSPMYQALKTATLAGPNGPVTAGGQLTDPMGLLKGLEYGLREETESQKAKVYSDLFQDNAGYVRGLTEQIGNGALSTREQRKVNIGDHAEQFDKVFSGTTKVTNSLLEGVNSVLGNLGVTTSLGTVLRFGSSFMGPISWGILALGATPGKLPGPVAKMLFGPLAHGAQNNISLEEQKPPEVHITNNVYVTTSGDNGHRIGEDVFRALGEKMRADLIRSGSHLYKY